MAAYNTQAADIPSGEQVPEAILKKSKSTKRKPAKKLGELFEIIREHDLLEAENIEITVLESIKAEFGKVRDPRNPSYVTYKLADILIIMLLAVLANNNTWYDIEVFGYSHKKFLTKLLGMENETMPTDDTYRLIVCHIDMSIVHGTVVRLLINRIDNVIEKYAADSEAPEPDIMSYDGKSSRSSGRKETFEQQKAKPLFTLNAYSSDYDMCVNQSFIDGKTNEIPEMPLLVKNMDISGAIVTCDALNTQPDTAAAIIGGGGKYIMPVKASNIWKLYHVEEWAGITAIGMVRRIFRSNKPGVSTTYADRYYILGGVSDIEAFSRAVRKHWNVENKCNWQLDYTMKDDANKTMEGSGAEGLQLMKKAALSVLNVARVLYKPYVSLNYIRSSICQGFEDVILRVLAILDVDSLIEANRNEFDMDTTV